MFFAERDKDDKAELMSAFNANKEYIDNLEIENEKHRKRVVQLFDMNIDKNNALIHKQKVLAAALVMVKTMHRQPAEYLEICGWLVEYVENKENGHELMGAYMIVNNRKTWHPDEYP